MIISHFWLPESTRDAGATTSEEFFALVTNLEPVPLRFRFTFLATQTHWPQHDSTDWLRSRVLVLGGGGDTPPTEPKIQPWSRDGNRYWAACELGIGAGETDFAALRFVPPMNAEAAIQSIILHLPRALRGHWELALPALPVSARVGAASKPQLDRPARVLVSALRRLVKRSWDSKAKLMLHELAPWPGAAEAAERLIPADKGALAVATTGPPRAGVTLKRGGAKRERSTRRRR